MGLADNEALFEVTSMFRTLIKRISQEWNKNGGRTLSFPQFKVLYMLNKLGPQRVSQLAEMLCITPAAVTGITDKLLAEGYVQRDRAESDRRVVVITLTDKGEVMIREAKDIQKKTIEMIFTMLPDEDIEHLRRIFAEMLFKMDHTD